MSTSPTVSREAPWQVGLHSARLLLWPGLALQAAAVTLVLVYYFAPATRGGFDALAGWQTRGGILCSALSTGLCGGVLPFIFLRMSPSTRASYPWSQLWFFVLFWAWKGAEVDLWYRALTAMFGSGTDALTIAKKAVVDQFGFNALYASPIGSVCFAWKDAGYRWAPVAADLRAGNWFYRRVIPILIAVWFLWIPISCCVYALPQALQIPLFNVVLVFWSLLFAHITARQNRG